MDLFLHLCFEILMGALLGRFHHWIAIKLVFWPTTPKYMFGRRIPLTPGIVVARLHPLAGQLATMVQNDLADRKQIVDFIVEKIDLTKIANDTSIPLVRFLLAFYPGRQNASIFRRHVDQIIEKVLDSSAVKDIVEQRIKTMDAVGVVEMLERVAHDELRGVVRLGGYVGGIIGILHFALSQILSWILE